MNKLLSTAIIALSFIITAPSAIAAKYTLKVAHGAPTNFHMHKAWEKFKEVVEKESNGDIEVNLFPAGQLGEDRELLEYVQNGTIDMNASTVAVLAGWDPIFAASELPYMFPNRKVALRVLNGDYGKYTAEHAADLGLMQLGFFETGFREISNNRHPIYSPEDLKGIKIRTMQVDAHILAFKALGANPTPMAFGEIYSALQQKVVDAQENPLGHIVANRFYEVSPYISMTNHVYSTHIVVINPDKFNSLPKKYQDLVKKGVIEGEKYQQGIIKKEEQENLAFLKENGAKVNTLTPEQQKVFQDRMLELTPQFEDLVGKEAYKVLTESIKKEEKAIKMKNM